MAEGQDDVEMHDLSRGELSNQWSGSVENGFMHMRRQQGLWLRLANDINAGHDRNDREHKYDESLIHDFSLTPASWKIFTQEMRASAEYITRPRWHKIKFALSVCYLFASLLTMIVSAENL